MVKISCLDKEFLFFFYLYFTKLSLYPLDHRLHHQPTAPSWTSETRKPTESYKPDGSHTLHVLALPSLHVASNSSNRWEWQPRCLRDSIPRSCCRRDSTARQRQIDMRIHRCCLIDNEDIVVTTTTKMLIRSEKSPPSNRSTAVMKERPRVRIYESKQTMWHWEHLRVRANNATRERASVHLSKITRNFRIPSLLKKN